MIMVAVDTELLENESERRLTCTPRETPPKPRKQHWADDRPSSTRSERKPKHSPRTGHETAPKTWEELAEKLERKFRVLQARLSEMQHELKVAKRNGDYLMFALMRGPGTRVR